MVFYSTVIAFPFEGNRRFWNRQVRDTDRLN